MFNKLWIDESGAVLSAELIVVLSILVGGLVVGVNTLRNALTTELMDVSEAIHLNQSYQVGGINGYGCYTAGSVYIDVD